MSSSELVNYQVQLQQVESALTVDPNNEELLKLKEDLKEVIQLTKSLLGESSDSFASTQGTSASSAKSGQEFRSGDSCMAPWSEDGQFYEAKIEDVTSDGQCTVIFHSLPNGKHRVSEVCLLSLLKPSQTQRKKTIGKHTTASGSNKADPQQQREMIKKKQQKKQSRFKELEEARERDKMKWKQFNQKAVNKHLKGALSLAKKQSIFKSPDTVEGKVGVGTCGIGGKGMTNFVVADKYKKAALSVDNLPSNISATMQKPSSSYGSGSNWYRKPQ